MRGKYRNRAGGEHVPRDHYAEVTARVIAALEAGTPPWRQEWVGQAGLPENATTGARYRGINILILGMAALASGDGDPRWATYKQAADHGWQVRKGSRGTTAFLFKRIEVDGDTGKADEDRRFIPMLKAFTLFHSSQIEGIPPYQTPGATAVPWREPEATATIVRNSGAVIKIGGDRAYYSPATDHIQLPPSGLFRSAAALVSTQLHEMAHWTGHESRLNRDFRSSFGSDGYAQEELRAELAQVMVSAELGLDDAEFLNGTAYLASWLSKLRQDKREIFRAAADAQRIADYLLAFHPDYRHPDERHSQAEPAITPEDIAA